MLEFVRDHISEFWIGLSEVLGRLENSLKRTWRLWWCILFLHVGNLNFGGKTTRFKGVLGFNSNRTLLGSARVRISSSKAERCQDWHHPRNTPGFEDVRYGVGWRPHNPTPKSPKIHFFMGKRWKKSCSVEKLQQLKTGQAIHPLKPDSLASHRRATTFGAAHVMHPAWTKKRFVDPVEHVELEWTGTIRNPWSVNLKKSSSLTKSVGVG